MYCMSLLSWICAQSHMGVHFCKIFPCEFLHNCISACTKHIIQDVMQLHSCEGPCEAMVLQCASVTVGSSAPLRVLATRSVSELARADKDTSFSLMIAAERGGRQMRDGSCATAGGLEVGHKEIPIWTTPTSHPIPQGTACTASSPPRLTQSPEQEAQRGQKLGYILYTMTCQFVRHSLCHGRDCIF